MTILAGTISFIVLIVVFGNGYLPNDNDKSFTIKDLSMTITTEEVKKDFQRFIRHEAMRANCLEEEITNIIKDIK